MQTSKVRIPFMVPFVANIYCNNFRTAFILLGKVIKIVHSVHED